MFRRFHKKLQEKEGGFTLIELLVVILIIAILAAIAIPVFLSQREKGWVSQVESALKNAATAQESYLVANGTYTEAETGVGSLAEEGFKKAEAVTDLTITADEARSYCIQAGHANLDAQTWAYDSEVGTPEEGTC
jgi:type IV pilus assembly protein PilA